MIIVPIILGLIPFIYPEVKALFMRKMPQFVIEDPIISRGDSVLHIFAENNPARRREALNIEVEGLEFRDAGKLVRENPLEWEFNFNQYDIPDLLFSEGLNAIRIGFPNSVGYDELNVYVHPDFYQNDDIAIGQEFVPKVNNVDSSETNEIRRVYVASNVKANDERVGVITSALRGHGIAAKPVTQKVHTKTATQNEIRYFNAADKEEVEKLEKMFKEDLKIDVKIINEGKKLELLDKAKQNSRGVINVILAEPSES